MQGEAGQAEPAAYRSTVCLGVSGRLGNGTVYELNKLKVDIYDNMKNGDKIAWSYFRRYYRLDKGVA